MTRSSDLQAPGVPVVTGCCGPAEQKTCCEPSDKAECCGTSPAGSTSCGCK